MGSLKAPIKIEDSIFYEISNQIEYFFVIMMPTYGVPDHSSWRGFTELALSDLVDSRHSEFDFWVFHQIIGWK